ncbi:hypothetical protein [Microcoleus sp. B4-D4]|uniref:hypothetical protein n=1 Tax=Microcoleus sp. B4-D4 TaxID=2818667 RepID=UPI002FD62633
MGIGRSEAEGLGIGHWELARAGPSEAEGLARAGPSEAEGLARAGPSEAEGLGIGNIIWVGTCICPYFIEQAVLPVPQRVSLFCGVGF